MKPPVSALSGHKELWEAVKQNRLPEHIAIIMDGNGRWAEKRGLNRVKGHKAGIKAVKNALDTVLYLGIDSITLYAFSTENWERPAFEVSVLMTLLRQFIRLEEQVLKKNNIRLRVLGDIERLPFPVRSEIYSVIERTSGNTGLNFNLALNYGSRNEILKAVKQISKDSVNPEEITEELFESYLYTSELPDPDLLIRTSGEMRISNFLLWQLAYSELYFTDVLWPDFDTGEMLHALLDFQNRERRFGGLSGNRS
jgi:undecaprenyl diphosphate synthase